MRSNLREELRPWGLGALAAMALLLAFLFATGGPKPTTLIGGLLVLAFVGLAIWSLLQLRSLITRKPRN